MAADTLAVLLKFRYPTNNLTPFTLLISGFFSIITRFFR